MFKANDLVRIKYLELFFCTTSAEVGKIYKVGYVAKDGTFKIESEINKYAAWLPVACAEKVVPVLEYYSKDKDTWLYSLDGVSGYEFFSRLNESTQSILVEKQSEFNSSYLKDDFEFIKVNFIAQ